jgi:thermitase
MKKIIDSLYRVHALHWIILVVAATGAALLILSSIGDMVAEIKSDAVVAAAFKAGRVIGVSDERVLVSFKDSASEAKRSTLKKKYGLEERGYIPQLGVHQFEIPAGKSASDIAKLIAGEVETDFAEPDYLIEPSVMPNDPWFTEWQKNKVQMNFPSAWDTTTGVSTVVVAVADTGVNCAHEDLRSNCPDVTNTDVQGHGTAVAGVVGAVGNNGIGVAGGSWAVSLMPFTVSNSAGAASYSAIANAITNAANRGARVVNNSYQSGGSAAVQKAAKYLAGKGGVLVVSEGNYGKDTGLVANPYIVSVGAVDPNNALYTWSSYGADVDVVAPGCTGATTARGGGYGSFCGTSSAAAEVSGVLALIFAAQPALTAQDAITILTTSAMDMGATGWDTRFGSGMIDAAAAVLKASTYTPSTPVTSDAKKPR